MDDPVFRSFDGQLPDVCYSWWVLASLKIIGRIHWIDKAKLRAFILACQDEETGGFADRPGDMVSQYGAGPEGPPTAKH